MPRKPAAKKPPLLVPPPRPVVMARNAWDPPPVPFDPGSNRRIALTPGPVSLGIPGIVSVDVDEDGGVSVSTPVGGVTVDQDGVAVDAGEGRRVTVGKDGASVEAGGGRATVGKDGASLTFPGLGTVTVDRGGRVTVTPPEGGPTLPGAPTDSPSPIGWPFPSIEAKPFEITIPVPRFVTEPFVIPIQIPRAQVDLLHIPLPFPRPDPQPVSIPVYIPRFDLPPFPGIPAAPKPERPTEPAPALSDPLAVAIAEAVELWRPQARIGNLRVEGASAFGSAGCLVGPVLEPIIRAQPAFTGLSGDEETFAKCVADAVSDGFRSWQEQLLVPGLPWYPAFAAWPGPIASPMPNVPTPLSACISPDVGAITSASRLKAEILSRVPTALFQAFEDRARELARELSQWFEHWLDVCQVTQVMGQGPVPNFAPPVVLVGPVAGGTAQASGPCLV